MSAAGNCLLLIDDDSDIHHAVRLILEPRGYLVECRSTGNDGLDAIGKISPDIILLDIMLSSPTEGLKLANKLKNDPNTREIPIIVLSAIGLAAAEDLARDANLNFIDSERFLDKPLIAPDLIAAVNQACGRE